MASVVRSITEARRSTFRSQRSTQLPLTRPRPVHAAAQPPVSPRFTIISNPVTADSGALHRQSSASSSVVRQLPQRSQAPDGLKILIQTHRVSIILAFVLGIAALTVYGSTVYTQQLWSKEYRKLKTLQRSERELLAAGESLKGQVAQQAEGAGSQLVPKTPSSLIFLKPEPPRSTPAQSAIVPGMPSPGANKLQPSPRKPLGY